MLNSVEPYEHSRVEKIKARIYESLQKLEGVTVDNNRFEQELIFYIEKLDITEEKIRLQNHLNYFLATMADGDNQGKNLDLSLRKWDVKSTLLAQKPIRQNFRSW